MSKKFLKFTDADPEVKEMFPSVDIYVANNSGDDICGIAKSYQIGRKKQPAAIFQDGLSEMYMTSECLRQLADKLDSLNGNLDNAAIAETNTTKATIFQLVKKWIRFHNYDPIDCINVEHFARWADKQ